MGKRTIDLVVEEARRKGMTDVEAARAMGVEKQVFSNWKRRGMPPAMHQRAAEFLGCSIDSLLGRSPLAVREQQSLYGYGLTRDGAHVGAEWQKLEDSIRQQIQTLIETLVALQVRNGRKKQDPARPPRAKTAHREA